MAIFARRVSAVTSALEHESLVPTQLVLEQQLDDVRDPVALLVRRLWLSWGSGCGCAAVVSAIVGSLRSLREMRVVRPLSSLLRFTSFRCIATRNDLLGIRPTVGCLVVAAAACRIG